ncbi:hypothetical protein, partial [Vibrio lentus]|uniref:hypothetical protein n=2 Tax=Vibrionaceae TaxID=641 RepID=UPI001A7E0DB2
GIHVIRYVLRGNMKKVLLLIILMSLPVFAASDKFWDRQFFKTIGYSDLVTQDNRETIKPIFRKIDGKLDSREWSDQEKLNVLVNVIAFYLAEIASEQDLSFEVTLTKFKNGQLNSNIAAMYADESTANIVNQEILKVVSQRKDEVIQGQISKQERLNLFKCIIDNMKDLPENMKDMVASYCKMKQKG